MRTQGGRGERVSGPTEIEGVTLRMDGRRRERRLPPLEGVGYKVENKAAAAAAAAAGEGRRGWACLEARRVGERANCKNGRMGF